jgi:GNAT superfamily N-acetyltransferase
MLTLTRTNSENLDFQELVKQLDEDLARRDGDEHAFYSQFNKTSNIRHVVVCYKDGQAVGCGAFRQYGDEAVEIKRMFVAPTQRGKGVGAKILYELENWAEELGNKKTLLETGKKQPEAIRLYEKSGYKVIPNFGQYENVENSVCMLKVLTPVYEKDDAS